MRKLYERFYKIFIVAWYIVGGEQSPKNVPVFRYGLGRNSSAKAFKMIKLDLLIKINNQDDMHDATHISFA